jgi:hypothetical protein
MGGDDGGNDVRDCDQRFCASGEQEQPLPELWVLCVLWERGVFCTTIPLEAAVSALGTVAGDATWATGQSNRFDAGACDCV